MVKSLSMGLSMAPDAHNKSRNTSQLSSVLKGRMTLDHGEPMSRGNCWRAHWIVISDGKEEVCGRRPAGIQSGKPTILYSVVIQYQAFVWQISNIWRKRCEIYFKMNELTTGTDVLPAVLFLCILCRSSLFCPHWNFHSTVTPFRREQQCDLFHNSRNRRQQKHWLRIARWNVDYQGKTEEN